MDDNTTTTSLFLAAFKLVRDLESNLPNLSSHPHLLSNSCDQIISLFTAARDSLPNLNAQSSTTPSSSSSHPLLVLPHLQSQIHQYSSSLQEWLRTSCTSSLEDQLLQPQLISAQRNTPSTSRLLQQDQTGSMGVAGLFMELGGRDVQPPATIIGSSSQRPRRRKDEAEKRTVRVAAPRIGNTDIPPEDGFTWRKYGQKEILGSRFPRGYYRCTHQKLYQCPAKKQVQKLDDDPFTFEVTYRGEHTCHMSATAPSIPPSAGSTSQPPPPATSLSSWLEFSLGGAGAGAGAGPSSSSSRYAGKEGDQFPITDMADAMFNSGSSSSNSMEFIFTSMEENKWDQQGQEDQKKN